MGRWSRATLVLKRHMKGSLVPPFSKNLRSPSLGIGFRFLSASQPASAARFDDNEFLDFDQKYAFEESREETEKISIKAYFLCTSIDLKSIQAENSSDVITPTSRTSNYVALRYCDSSPEIDGIKAEENTSCYRYMLVFHYGSAVLFNIQDHEVESYLEIVRRHASGLLSEMRKDDYAVQEKPLLMDDMQGGPDCLFLRNLDTDGIRIIGSVLGQSIALDYFVSQIDGMVEEFTDINRGMEKTGNFTMERKKLFQLVGKANSNLADVILKVGLFERCMLWSLVGRSFHLRCTDCNTTWSIKLGM